MFTKRITTLCILLLVLFTNTINAEPVRLKMATTTSTENSGLLAVLNPAFEEKFNAKVDVIAVGTGKAIRIAENGDVDLIMVHAPGAEKKFIEKGFGTERLPVMHNDFVIVGPKDDPAGLGQAQSLKQAMEILLEGKHPFISRGDDSGTHKKEKKLWETTGKDPQGEWYLSVGQSMGAVLRIADDKHAYALTDRGTYLAFMDKISLTVVFENDAALFNPYHVIVVNPDKHLHTNVELAQKYIDFIRGEDGQRIIREFKINGKTLFHPDVIK